MNLPFKVGDKVIDTDGDIGIVEEIDLNDSTIYVDYHNGLYSMFNLEGSNEEGNTIVHTTELDKALE